MKKKSLWLGPLLLFGLFVATACGGPFRGQSPQQQSQQAAGDDTSAQPVSSDMPEVKTEVQSEQGSYEIIRNSQEVTLDKIETKMDKNQISLNAHLVVAGKDQGPIEMVGQSSADETLLVPKDPELQDKYKAKVVCTSEDGLCSEYFVDFFVHDGKTVYVHQFIKDSPMKPQDKPDKPEDLQAQPSEDQPVTDQSEVPQAFRPNSLTPATSTSHPTTQTPASKSVFSPSTIMSAFNKIFSKTTTTVTTTTSTTTTTLAPAQPDDDDDEEEGDTANVGIGGYVGTSDNEIVQLFEKLTGTSPTKPVPPQPGQPQPPVSQSVTSSPKASPLPDHRPPPIFNQAIDLPYKGHLQNATNLLSLSLAKNYPFTIMWPEKKRYFSTEEMASVLQSMGDSMQSKVNGYKLILSDVSAEHGGPTYTKGKRSHKGHQNGNDVDISYVVKDSNAVLTHLVTKRGKKLSRELMLSEQWALMKAAVKTNQVVVIFTDPVIKQALCYEAQQEGDLKDRNDRGFGYEVLRRLQPEKGHDNHFHMRIMCGQNDRRCRNQNWVYKDSGCFGSFRKVAKGK